MLRKEVQEKAGLTRKAIEYYEERDFVKPRKAKNGYREYSEEDLKILKEVSRLRKAGLSISEIEEVLILGMNSLATVLRRKEYQLEMSHRKKEILELMVKEEREEKIEREFRIMEQEENVYEKLERAFPGYFGQMLFISYQPFLQEPLREGGEEAFENFVKYLDGLPPLILSKDEREFIETISSSFSLDILKDVSRQRMVAVEDPKKWWKENEEAIKQYEEFKKSKEFLESPIMKIKERLSEYMKENRYYEIAIPLIRRFSESYDIYYKKMMEAEVEIRGRGL